MTVSKFKLHQITWKVKPIEDLYATVLHREGDWYLLDRKSVGNGLFLMNYLSSVIWHECPIKIDSWNGMWRLVVKTLNLPCPQCGDVCPEEIQGLWLLHNWDALNE